jgi:Tfp pilus assembly protein PilF
MRTIHSSLGIALLWILASSVYATCAQVIPDRAAADSNNAVIEGRVVLPSGLAVDRNIKITVRNSQSLLNTLYTNKHGEFQISNLSQGVYYLQAEVNGAKDTDTYESPVAKVLLGRGIVYELTLELREKADRQSMMMHGRVVSAAELRQSVPAAAKKEYNLALKMVEKGDFVKAAAHFAQALEIFPDYLAARNDLGAQYLKLKRLDEAEEHFRIVLERDPKNFNAKFNFGLVRIERQNYPDAILQLNQAIAMDSARPTARLWLGFALLETGDLSGAERELSKAMIMGGSDCAAAHYHLARIYMGRGDSAEALRSLKAYLQESPKGEYAKQAKELAEKLEGKSKRQTKP